MKRSTESVVLTSRQLRLKEATLHVVNDLGGYEAASKLTRVRAHMLAKYCDAKSSLFVPVDVVLELERAAGTPHITAELAALHGYKLRPRCVSRPLPTFFNPRSLPELMALISEALGGVFSAYFRFQGLSAMAAVEQAHQRQNLAQALEALMELCEEAHFVVSSGEQVSSGVPLPATLPVLGGFG